MARLAVGVLAVARLAVGLLAVWLLAVALLTVLLLPVALLACTPTEDTVSPARADSDHPDWTQVKRSQPV